MLPRIVFSLIWITVSGCIEIAPRTTAPPPEPEMRLPGIRVIAFGEVDGRGDDEIAQDLIQALLEAGRFRIVDRNHTKRMLREVDLRDDWFLDQGSANQVGRFLGAEAYLFVDVSEYDTDRYTDLFDRRGRRATVEFFVQIIDLRTAQILVARRIRRTATAFGDDIDSGALLSTARNRAARAFAQALVP